MLLYTPPRARRIGALFAALLSVSAAAATAETAECHAMDLEKVWLQSVTQADDGSLLAVNPLELSVLTISPEGRVTGAFTGLRIGARTYPFNPSRIQRLDDGTFLLANAADEIAQVHPLPAARIFPKSGANDLDFRVQSSTLPLHASPPGSQRLAGMYGWAGTSDGHVLAFADVIREDESYVSGFVWFNRWNPASFKILYEVEPNALETEFYAVLHPYVAAVPGGKAYFLAMGETPTLYEYSQDQDSPRKLRAFPEGARVRPEIPEERGVIGLPKIYESLADAVTPLGIYPWEGSDHIGLLTRRPKGNGLTDYALTRIDPAKDQVLYTLHLPADRARHVTLAPGLRHWLVLLKSEVRAIGDQDVTGLLRLPHAWFKDKTSPLMQAGMRVECR